MDESVCGLLVRLAAGGSTVAFELACQEDLPEEVLDVLVTSAADHAVRGRLVQRTDLTLEHQWRMLRCGFSPVALSANEHLSPAVQEWLAGVLVQDHDAALLAANPTLTRESCRILLTDSLLHPILGENPSLDPIVRRRWLESNDPTLLSHVAANPRLSVPEVETLAAGGDLHVRQRLARNPVLPLRLQAAWASDPSLQVPLAQNPGLAVPLQERLVGARAAGTRAALASRGDLAPRVAATLSFDPDPDVVGNLVRGVAPATRGWSVRSLRHRPLDLEGLRVAAGCDMESWTSLASSWSGSVEDLIEAVRLLRRGE